MELGQANHNSPEAETQVANNDVRRNSQRTFDPR